MTAPPIPPDEAARIKELESLHQLDTPAEERFDRIVRLAAGLFDVPVALISLVDENRVWFKARHGLDAPEIPREISFCAHAILSPEAMLVPDARLDDRFKDNPFVTGEPHIQFYAGYPLADPGGHRVGNLCLVDYKPRRLKKEDLQSLKDLAALAVTELGLAQVNQLNQALLRERNHLRNQALVDSLTRLWNRGAILEILEMEWKKASRTGSNVGIIMADLDHFKNINDTFGHPTGDVVLLETAYRIRSCLRSSDSAGRYGGEEFLMVFPKVDDSLIRDIAERIRSAMESSPIVTPKGILKITLSLGCGVTPIDRKIPMDSIIAQVDKALYQAKKEGRNRVSHCVLE